MSLKKSSVELLSPCGSPETLDAAITGGADAVYLGGTILNARMNAKNFTDADLSVAIDKCHANGVRLYVTLNTLVYDKEFDEAVRYAAKLYKMGVDAFIIADIGLAVALKRYIPDIELHASTQMSAHNSSAALRLADIGFSRMVAARELSIDDIRNMTDKLDIEMFIHGAHCVSVSGQCLMSSFIGGRSGNRGECAQPCRMKYNGGYPLSLKDMCLAGHITEIIGSGVKSLKIEGRMKSPDYVYTVTSTYRKLLNEQRNATVQEMDKLSKIFSRSGFTDGYFTGNIDKTMLGIRTESDKTDTQNVKVAYKKAARTIVPIIIGSRDITLPDGKIKPDKITDRITPQKSARFLNANQIPDHHSFDIVYLPFDKYDESANGIILPAVIKDSEIIKTIKNGVKHALVGNLGHIDLLREFDVTLHGDFRLNIYNNQAMKYYDFFADNILSPELTLPQIRDIGGNKCVIVYGKVPVMTLERPIDIPSLKDRTNAVFNVYRDGKQDIVYNSVPIYMADKKSDLKKSGVINTHFIFTDENKSEVTKIIQAYDKGLPYNKNFKRIK